IAPSPTDLLAHKTQRYRSRGLRYRCVMSQKTSAAERTKVEDLRRRGRGDGRVGVDVGELDRAVVADQVDRVRLALERDVQLAVRGLDGDHLLAGNRGLLTLGNV